MTERREDYPQIIEKLDAHGTFLARIDERQATACRELAEIKNHLALQNGRVSRLENWRSWIAGGLAVLAGIGGILVWLIRDFVEGE